MKNRTSVFLLALFALGMTLMGATPESKYDKIIFDHTAKYEVERPGNAGDPLWHKGRIMQESGFRENVVSPAGAIGLCQFIQETADHFGVNPWNPESSIDGMIRYTMFIRDYYNANDGVTATHFNAFDRASSRDKEMIVDAGYNWRMDRITRLCRAYGWNWDALKLRLPQETRNYAPSIQRWKEKFTAEYRKKKLNDA